MTSVFELDGIVSILKVLLEVANELQAQFRPSRDRMVTKLSKSLKYLPVELLPQIFQYAVWERGENGGRDAVRLSHVSQAFRAIALQTRGLWTTIHSLDSPSQLKTFLHRAGPNEDIHAYIHSVPRTFVTICRPTMQRWKTLTFTQAREKETTQPFHGGPGLETALEKLLGFLKENSIKLLSLEEFNVHGHRGEKTRSLARRFAYESWALNLRTIRCLFFLPSPVRVSSVSTFICTLSLSGLDSLMRLLNFLLAVPNLSTFELELYGASKTRSNQSTRIPKCSLSYLTSFHLRLREFNLDEYRDQGEEYCIVTLMDVLRTPSLEKFAVSVEFCGLDDSHHSELDGVERTEALGRLSRALLSTNLSDYSRMVSLSYKFCIGGCMSLEPTISNPFRTTTLNIPFDRMLHIPTVTLSTPFRVVSVHPEDGADSRIQWSEQCRLRELKLIGCENMMSMDLKQIIGTLRVLGVWDNIEHIVVEDCVHLSYDEVEDVLGKEKLQFLHHV
ncbi:hypothetical protein SCHPADRAFT_1001041 [Schizopora paradoxa]|uniref:Uncharacterized protein n=1 Tax=Schizopora paradoxa TaxID=27342 RepID=A0A0H2R8V7_9AGAM|nr:hypothetical protein SCHPADRAFT_1001041 [Schizopora paradoxa]